MRDTPHDILIKAFSDDIDNNVARQNAEQLAQLFGSSVTVNKQIILNEPFFPFKVSAHTKDFYCFVLLSDVSYCFTAKRRSRTPYICDFFVSLKAPTPHMSATARVPRVSEQLGVDVFRQVFAKNKEIEAVLSSKRLQGMLKRIDFSGISEFEFNPIQLTVISSLHSLESCRKQTLLFQSLMGIAIKEAYERHKHVEGLAWPLRP